METKKVKVQGNYKTKKQAIKAAFDCIETYYAIGTKRNDWRIKEAKLIAEKSINETGVYKLKGAQWGDKWGNYYRLIALNSKGQYQYTEGFKPERNLL